MCSIVCTCTDKPRERKPSEVVIYSASKTQGLFAGVSLEGSVIVERKDANTKFYGGPVSEGTEIECESEMEI